MVLSPSELRTSSNLRTQSSQPALIGCTKFCLMWIYWFSNFRAAGSSQNLVGLEKPEKLKVHCFSTSTSTTHTTLTFQPKTKQLILNMVNYSKADLVLDFSSCRGVNCGIWRGSWWVDPLYSSERASPATGSKEAQQWVQQRAQ